MLMQNQNCNCSRLTREELFNKLNEVSFAVDDVILFLDTHPCDEEAMAFYESNVKMRDKLLREYAKYYGPLTLDTAYECENGTWQWVLQPWPWENKGGCC